MNPALAIFVLLDAALLAVWAVVTAALRRGPGIALLGGLLLLELTVVVQAVLHGRRLAAGEPVAELPTHLGYLVTSVALLPLLLSLALAPDRGPFARDRRAVVFTPRTGRAGHGAGG